MDRDDVILCLLDRAIYFNLLVFKETVDKGRDAFLENLTKNKPVKPDLKEAEMNDAKAKEYEQERQPKKKLMFISLGVTVVSIILSRIFLTGVFSIISFFGIIATIVFAIKQHSCKSKKESCEYSAEKIRKEHESYPERLKEWEAKVEERSNDFDKICNEVKDFDEQVSKLRYDEVAVPREYDNIKGLTAIIDLLKTDMADDIRDAVNQLEEKRRYEEEMELRRKEEMHRQMEARRQAEIQEKQIKMQEKAEKDRKLEERRRADGYRKAQQEYNAAVSSLESARRNNFHNIYDYEARVEQKKAELLKWK